ncbi:MAG: hypothetical protein GF403_01095 [Candidatus Coatesbacteria bacterium]|nr:hypothetical protein [Candidatus Coatesbacteria bacterium]
MPKLQSIVCLLLSALAAAGQGPPAESLELEREGVEYRCEPRTVEGDYHRRFDGLTCARMTEEGWSEIGSLELTLDGAPLGGGLSAVDLEGDGKPELAVWTFTAGNDVTASSGLVLLRPTPRGLVTLFSSLGGGALPLDVDGDGIQEVLCFGSWWPAHLGRVSRVEFANQVWLYNDSGYTPAALTDFPGLYTDMADSHADQLFELAADENPDPAALVHHAAGELIHLALGGLDGEYAAAWEQYGVELRPTLLELDPEGWNELELFFGTGPENVRLALTPATRTIPRLVGQVEFYGDCGYYRVDALGHGTAGLVTLELYYIDDSQQDFVEWHLVYVMYLNGPRGTTIEAEDADGDGRTEVVLVYPNIDGGSPVVTLEVGLDGFSPQ